MKRKGFLHCRKGIGTVTSVLMLILMLVILTGLITVYLDYNLSAQAQMQLELERSKEKIYFLQMELDDELVYISSLTIHNAGTIDVRIRALYVEKDGETTFIVDPSTYMDTYIPPNENRTIRVESETQYDEANIIAATERGTTTIEYEPYLIFKEDEIKKNPSELTLGPLLLKFTDFKWRHTLKTGALDPADTWHDGWTIKAGTQCAWKITVKNVDSRTTSIKLNNYTGFNAVSADGSANAISWYLDTPSLDLPYNEPRDIIFRFKDWDDPSPVSIQSVECSIQVFLTCYGVYKWADGRPDSYYAQTIPFEALLIVKK